MHTTNFPGGEIPHQPHLAGEAEVAVHRAADLAGDAERLFRRVRDVDGFDLAAIRELEEKLARAIHRSGVVNQYRRRDDEPFRQRRTELDRGLDGANKVLEEAKAALDAAHKASQEAKAAVHRREMDLKQREQRIVDLQGKLGGATSHKE